jgi:hypothetical protein
MRNFVVTAADLKALKAPPPDADVLLVPVQVFNPHLGCYVCSRCGRRNLAPECDCAGGA